MNRRTFLRGAAALPATLALSNLPGVVRDARAGGTFDPRPGNPRTFEITTRVEIISPGGATRVWLPLPSFRSDFQQPQGDRWSGNAAVAKRMNESGKGPEMLYAEFPADESAPVVELVSRVTTQDRAVDWSKMVDAAAPADLARWMTPTDLMPTAGIVGETASLITKGKTSDVDKVRSIYDWILATTYREPAVRGCGNGDIRAMLETKNFGGKCGDINGLFVGLVRAAGIPARDLYGIRVAPSAFGYKTLGAGSENVTRSQHCRAEVYLREYGWVAMDPADVAKVAREENAWWVTLDDPSVTAVRPKLFGGWEGNWIAFNTAHDVALPNASSAGKLGFFMYPEAETGGERRDCLNSEAFKYTITARQV